MKFALAGLLLPLASALVLKRSVAFSNGTLSTATLSSSTLSATASSSIPVGSNGTVASIPATSVAGVNPVQQQPVTTQTLTSTATSTVPFDARTVIPVIIQIGVTVTTIVQAPAYTQRAYAPFEDRPSWVNEQNLAVLAPVIPANIDTSNPIYYIPSSQTTIQYASAPQGNVPSRDVSNIGINFQHPAVVIDHTDFIAATYAGPNAMNLQFANAQAMQYAATQWLPAGQPAVVLVAYLPGSPDYKLGGNTYFTAINIVCNAQQLRCTAQGIDGGLDSAMKDFDADFSTDFIPVYSDTKTGSSGMGSSAPVSSTNGLPSCAFGDDFDDCLDRQIGYIDFKSNLAAGVNEIAPGAVLDDTGFLLDKRQRTVELRQSRLSKRCCDFLKRTFRAVVAPVQKYIVEPVKKAVVVIKNAVDELTSIDRTLQTTKSLQYPPSDYGSYVTSPFGDKSIVISQSEDLNTWCVDCGTSGSVTISGRLAASLSQGFTAAYVGMSGSVAAEVNIGVEAKKEFKRTFNKKLAETGVKYLEAQPFYRIGPALIVGIDVDIGLEVRTQFIAGARAEINNFEARVDLVNPGSSFQKNFVPSFTKRFNANGQIKGSIDVGFPVSIAFGIDILSGKFKRDIALVEKPGVHLDATVAFYASSTEAPRIVTINGCRGIEFNVGLFNKVFAVVGTTNYPLADFSVPLVKSCFQIAGVEDAPSSAPVQQDPADGPVVGGSTTPPSDSDPSTPPADTGSTDPPAESNPDGGQAADPPVARKRQVKRQDLGTSSSSSSSASVASSRSSSSSASSSTSSSSSLSSTLLVSTAQASSSTSISGAAASSSSAALSTVLPSSSAPASSSSASSSTASQIASTLSSSVASASPTLRSTPSSLSNSTAGGNGTVTVGRLTDKTTFNASDTLDGYSLPSDLLGSGAFNGTDGLDLSGDESLVRIINQENGLLWMSDYDGNFYLEQISNAGQSVGQTDFVFDGELIIVNPREQYMFFYDDEMSKLGVSRLRTNVDDKTPKTATLLAFQPIDYGNGLSALGALDSQQNIFYVVTCDIPSRGTMLFVARDPNVGAATLMSDAIQSSITGGKVTDCYYLDYAMMKTGGV